MPVTLPIVSASGAKSTKTLPSPVIITPGGEPTPGLFFKMPDVSASTKKVFAHLFGPWPRSLFNENPQTDYYARNLINPTGEGGKHVSYGGFMRDRPMPRPPRPQSNWQYLDVVDDITWARNAGVDGFFCNIMGGDSAYYSNARAVANDLFPGFYVLPMIDVAGSHGNPTEVAAQIAAYNRPSRYVRNGFMIAGTFLTEAEPLSYWKSITDICQSVHGISLRWIFVFNNHSTFNNYTSISIATGVWGPGADPLNAGPSWSAPRSGLGMVPTWLQDIRPHNLQYREAVNLGSLRAHWDKIISVNAEYVQMTTWSDFSETSSFTPTPAHGFVGLDISSWYIARWKTGVFPQILKDAIYLSYRNHVPNAPILNSQAGRLAKVSSSPTTYNVEAMVFLTAPATVEITIAGNTSTFSAPAGMSVHTKPVTAAGNVSSRIVRSGATVASLAPPVVIRPNLWVDDKQYFYFSSVRGTAGQFDPTMTSAGQTPTYP